MFLLWCMGAARPMFMLLAVVMLMVMRMVMSTVFTTWMVVT